MKTIILAAILAGFVTTGSYAQDVDCSRVHVAGTCPGDVVRQPLPSFPAEQAACAGYLKGTSQIITCPDSIDMAGTTQFTINGNYPMVCTSHQRMNGDVVVVCRPKCVLMEDPATGREWYKCPND